MKESEKNDSFLIFLVSMMKLSPLVFLKPFRMGGGSQSVGFPISEKKQIMFAIRWTIGLLKNKNRILKLAALSDLLISTLYDKGEAIDKKLNVHDTAVNNRYY